MLLRRMVIWIPVGLMLVAASVVSGQDYPTKPIHILSGNGAAEVTARLIAQGISGPLAQPVVVENRGGNQQVIALNAAPDGYTTIISGSSLWLAPLTQKMPYDPVRDFAPVSIVGKTPFILYVTLSLPVKSVNELIAYAKARPGALNNSIGGVGGGAHIAGELFKSMTGVNIVAVPYSSDAQELTDLLSGRVQLSITTPLMMEQVKAGKLRALAVTTAEQSALAPELPTLAASGLPGFDLGMTIGMFAPAKTPQVIINRLNQEVVRVIKTAEARERLLSAGLEAVGSSPEDLAAKMKADIARVSKVIKDAGIEAK